jgi:hypothetical protein
MDRRLEITFRLLGGRVGPIAANTSGAASRTHRRRASHRRGVKSDAHPPTPPVASIADTIQPPSLASLYDARPCQRLAGSTRLRSFASWRKRWRSLLQLTSDLSVPRIAAVKAFTKPLHIYAVTTGKDKLECTGISIKRAGRLVSDEADTLAPQKSTARGSPSTPTRSHQMSASLPGSSLSPPPDTTTASQHTILTAPSPQTPRPPRAPRRPWSRRRPAPARRRACRRPCRRPPPAPPRATRAP